MPDSGRGSLRSNRSPYLTPPQYLRRAAEEFRKKAIGPSARTFRVNSEMASRKICSCSSCTSMCSGRSSTLLAGSRAASSSCRRGQDQPSSPRRAGMEALVIAGLHQPFRQGAVFAEARQLGKQVHTDGLKDVGRILMHAELDRNRVDEILVLVDQRRPGFLIALQAARRSAARRRSRHRPLGRSSCCRSCHRTPASGFRWRGPRT